MRQNISLDLEPYHYYASYLAHLGTQWTHLLIYLDDKGFPSFVLFFFARSNLVVLLLVVFVNFYTLCYFVLFFIKSMAYSPLPAPDGMQCFPPLLLVVHFLHQVLF